MRLNKEQAWAAIAILVFLSPISVPYLVAWPADLDLRSGGFLVNPIDGHSYLAKMRQGYEGSWTFKLPYTAEPGDGAAINLYYLFLGHAARTVGWPLIVIFHVARLTGALLLALALLRFFGRILPTVNQRIAGFVLALFGSGLGWLAFGFGLFTGDFWVAEAFPFLASFTNAHFPIGMALQVWLLTPVDSANRSRLWFRVVGAALLSIIYPFGWAITVVVLLGWVAWLVLSKQPWREHVVRAVWVLAGGLPYSVYALIVVHTHPMLGQWNAQNQTPALSLPDLLISLSPAALLAVVSLVHLRKQSDVVRFLVVWLVLGAAVLYVPVNLQRRLISGLYIPAAGLAVWIIVNKLPAVRWRRLAFLTLLALSLPTNLLIIFGGLQAVRTGDDALVVSQAELDAYAWLDQHADGALVLAAPASGLHLPAYSSVRVVYGHPFETIDAASREQAVIAFFEGYDGDVLKQADFIFYGPRELAIGTIDLPYGWVIAYDHNDVQVWVRGSE